MNGSLADPALPTLAQALDGRGMAVSFQAFFQRERPDRALAVGECEVESVRHKPGKRCRISYRLSGTEDGDPFERRLTCRVLAPDRSPDRYLEGAPESTPGCAPWRPASWWPEMKMVIYVFPYDPELAGLASLLDPAHVRSEVDRRIASWGWPRPWRAEEVEARPVKYRSGRRCLIRYRVGLAGSAGARQQLSFFGKTYDSAQSRYVYDALVAIHRSMGEADRGFEIPRPLAHIDAANTLWQEAWAGESPRQRAARLGWARCLDAATLERVAALIAAIHQTEPASLQVGSSPAALIENARSDVEHIRAFLPEQGATLERLLELLAASAPAGRATNATLHGTFKLAQLLCRDDRVAVVDFDAVSMGDPLLDIGEFVASLVHLESRDGVATSVADAALEKFVAAYARAVPWRCERSRIAWYATAFLLGKTHSLFKKHDGMGLGNRQIAFQKLEAWGRRAAGAA